jgi:hypothetical protein
MPPLRSNIITLLFLLLRLHKTSQFYLIGSTGTLGSYISTHPSCIPLSRDSIIPDDGKLVISATPSTARDDVLRRAARDVSRLAFMSNGLSRPIEDPPYSAAMKVETTETCPYFGFVNGDLISSPSVPTIIHGPRASELSAGKFPQFTQTISRPATRPSSMYLTRTASSPPVGSLELLKNPKPDRPGSLPLPLPREGEITVVKLYVAAMSLLLSPPRRVRRAGLVGASAREGAARGDGHRWYLC